MATDNRPAHMRPGAGEPVRPPWLLRAAGALLLLLVAGALASVAFLGNEVQSRFGPALTEVPPYPLLIACAAALAGGACALARLAALPLERALAGRRGVCALALAGVATFALQLSLVRAVYGIPGPWDSAYMLEQAALASGNLRDMPAVWHGWYFSRCPNNIVLTALFTLVYKAAGSLGMGGLVPCMALGALMVDLGGVASAAALARVTGRVTPSVAFLVLYVPLVALSPWVSIPYSDAYGAGFTGLLALMSAHLLAGDRRRGPAATALLWLAFTLVALLGYEVKPTTLLPWIATLPLSAWRLAGRGGRRAIRGAAAMLAASAVAATIVLALVVPAATRVTGLEGRRDDAKEIGVAHYFMMGQNDATLGAFSPEDNAYSDSLDASVRTRENLLEGLRRIGRRGVAGNLTFYAKKAAMAFGDGTFAWTYEAGDGFISPRPGPPSDPVSSWLRRSLYRPAWAEGADMGPYGLVTTVWWLACVALWAPLGLRLARGGGNAWAAAMALAAVALGAYLLLFEDRARYVYYLTPVLVALSALGACGGMGRPGRKRHGR